MSPEQAAGRPDIDGRSDLYSLGVMGYAMLAGRLPFEGNTPGDVLVQHLTKEPPPLQAAAPEAPHALTAALMRCLAKDPSQRWQDAKSLKEALAPDDLAPVLPASLRILGLSAQAMFGALLINAYVRLYLASNSDPLSVPGFLKEPWDKVAFLAGGAVVYAAIQARRRMKLRWRAVLGAALAQPAWWPGWYPKALRWPGDLWPRLPPQIRAARQAVAAMIAAWALIVIPLMLVLTGSDTYYERTGTRARLGSLAVSRGPLLPLSLGLVSLGGVLGFVMAILWLKRRLGDEADWDELPPLSATWKKSSPWRRPAYEALLLPVEAEEAGAAIPRSEDELEMAVRRLADALPAELEELSERCQAAGRALRLSIKAIDREIAALARDADPQESARLADKLAALGPPTGLEPAGRREMRHLLAKQLSLVHGLSSRLDAARRERGSRFEMLRTLWLRLSSLPNEPARDPATDARAAEQLRALCAEIERGAAPSIDTIETPRGNIDELPTLDR
jgi:hypothetical protein